MSTCVPFPAPPRALAARFDAGTPPHGLDRRPADLEAVLDTALRFGAPERLALAQVRGDTAEEAPDA